MEKIRALPYGVYRVEGLGVVEHSANGIVLREPESAQVYQSLQSLQQPPPQPHVHAGYPPHAQPSMMYAHAHLPSQAQAMPFGPHGHGAAVPMNGSSDVAMQYAPQWATSHPQLQQQVLRHRATGANSEGTGPWPGRAPPMNFAPLVPSVQGPVAGDGGVGREPGPLTTTVGTAGAGAAAGTLEMMGSGPTTAAEAQPKAPPAEAPATAEAPAAEAPAAAPMHERLEDLPGPAAAAAAAPDGAPVAAPPPRASPALETRPRILGASVPWDAGVGAPPSEPDLHVVNVACAQEGGHGAPAAAAAGSPSPTRVPSVRVSGPDIDIDPAQDRRTPAVTVSLEPEPEPVIVVPGSAGSGPRSMDVDPVADGACAAPAQADAHAALEPGAGAAGGPLAVGAMEAASEGRRDRDRTPDAGDRTREGGKGLALVASDPQCHTAEEVPLSPPTMDGEAPPPATIGGEQPPALVEVEQPPAEEQPWPELIPLSRDRGLCHACKKEPALIRHGLGASCWSIRHTLKRKAQGPGSGLGC